MKAEKETFLAALARLRGKKAEELTMLDTIINVVSTTPVESKQATASVFGTGHRRRKWTKAQKRRHSKRMKQVAGNRGR